jgi:predicted nucleic acid-binding protein
MYLDSAIIVKLLVREIDSEWFARHLSGHSFESSELCLAEVPAALLFKERADNIKLQERNTAMEKFFSMIKSELVLPLALDRKVIARARNIQLACHPRIPLRTLDALHVATCDLHQKAMSATDGRIRSACGQLGIALVPEKIEELPR